MPEPGGLLTDPRAHVDGLGPLLGAWRALQEAGQSVYTLGQGVAVAELDGYERALEVALPAPLKTIWTFAGEGIEFAGLGIYGWPPDRFGSETVPIDGDAVPEQLRVVGGDGGDGLYAIWLPRLGDGGPSPAIYALYERFPEMVVAASGIVPLLVQETVIAIQIQEAPSVGAFAALGLPPELHAGDPDDPGYCASLAAWADPTFPEPGHHTWRKGHSAEDLAAVIDVMFTP